LLIFALILSSHLRLCVLSILFSFIEVSGLKFV
jgi:hypothetical protein